jgi:YHS domain-containing protein
MDDPIENSVMNTAMQMPEQNTLQPAKTIIATPSTVKDPVCGMNIDPKKAIEDGLVIEAEGKTYYFCSEECASEFHRHGPQPEESADTDQMPDMSNNTGKQADSHNHMDMGHKP